MSEPSAEHIVTEAIAKRLLDAQFPALAVFPLVPVLSSGTDNQIFRLGDKLCLRFPKAPWASQSAEREVNVLSHLKGLPLAVPNVFGLGVPGEDYPWHWSVMSWIPGEVVGTSDFGDMREAAETLASFILAMRRQRIDPNCLAGEINNFRGRPLRERDPLFRQAAHNLADLFDEAEMVRVWQLCLDAPDAPQPLWLHGDIHGGNLLKQNQRLAAVIDWGLSGVGDAACDLSAAWALFDQVERAVFLDALQASEAERLRGAGWALSIAAIFLAYNRERDVPTDMSVRTIRRVLEDVA